MNKHFATAANKLKFKQILQEFGRVLLFYLLILGVLAVLANLHLPSKQQYFCDAEQVVQWKNQPHFLSNNQYFAYGNTQSDEKSHSGKYSAKTAAGQTYTCSIKHPELTGQEEVTVHVWRYIENGGDGKIVLSIPGGILWEAGAEIVETNKDGWERIKLVHQLPKEARHKTLTIYLWSPGGNEVYFDDLEVLITQVEKM